MKKRFTNEQIVATLRQADGGIPVLEVCRKAGITEQTYYRWKKRYIGMGIAELARLRQLEYENRKLKSLVADLSLDKHMLEEVIKKSCEGGDEAGDGSLPHRRLWPWHSEGLRPRRDHERQLQI